MKPIAISPLTLASLLLVTSLAVYGCGGKATEPKPATTPLPAPGMRSRKDLRA
jgi:hypothetical protein